MKVKKLIKLLEDLDEDATVILSKDSEGNYFSPLSDVTDDCKYTPNNKWSGDIVSKDSKEGKDAVVLWPTN
jgi:hypothetical protein